MCNPALALGAIAQGAGIYRQQQAAKKPQELGQEL